MKVVHTVKASIGQYANFYLPSGYASGKIFKNFEFFKI
ncbi:hypothetical protein T06_8950 [Trichinella sp. T6]|nr:hypothetical protein T06_8950 [Trichinella sp. T6]